MNKKQQAAFIQKFNALIIEVGGYIEPTPITGGYIIPWAGHRLRCKPYAEENPWIACKWEAGNPELLQAYLNLKNGDACAEETPQSIAAYDAYHASVKAEHAAIKAKGLPHHNPYSLKWNHHGTAANPCPIDSLRNGLAPLLRERGKLAA